MARQYLSVAPAVLASARQVPAAPIPGAAGTVLVIFRRGAGGRVIDARATGGSREMQESALTSIRAWQLKPSIVNNTPVELVSAADFVFTNGTVAVQPTSMMTAKQLSPVLNYACPNAIAHHDPAAVELCKQQLGDVTRDSASTDLERLTAHDECGLALLNVNEPKPARKEIAAAIALAPKVLTLSDPEWAYLFLHRATAERQSGDLTAAQADEATARQSLSLAISASTGPARAYYEHLQEQLTEPGANATTNQ